MDVEKLQDTSVCFFVILIPIIYFNADISPLKFKIHYSTYFANQNSFKICRNRLQLIYFTHLLLYFVGLDSQIAVKDNTAVKPAG